MTLINKRTLSNQLSNGLNTICQFLSNWNNQQSIVLAISGKSSKTTQHRQIVIHIAATRQPSRYISRPTILTLDWATVATSPLALRWMHGSQRTECARRTTPINTWHEQAIKEWSRRVISIVACCHSAKLCAHSALALRSQHYLTCLFPRGSKAFNWVSPFWKFVSQIS